MSREHPIHVFINRRKFNLDDPVQTGASLKTMAGIPIGDVLFLQRPGDDEVVPNETQVALRNGDHLHSQPPADYGMEPALLDDAGFPPERTTVHQQPDGWSFLVVSEYELPRGYQPDRVRLLLKLAPTFPDAAPDMFWVHPEIKAPNGSLPRSTSTERLLGEDWQRFSWHMAGGAWTPGVSTLRDFLRCVAARFLRLD